MITAISPCVLPVLPILLVGGATGRRAGGGRSRSSRASSAASRCSRSRARRSSSALGLPDDFLRNLAIVLLFLLAATLIFPPVAHLLERPFYFLTRRRPDADANGLRARREPRARVRPVRRAGARARSPSLAATGDVGVRIVLVTLAYALGAALPMLAIAARRASGSPAASTSLRRDAPRIRVARRRRARRDRARDRVQSYDQRFTTALPGYTQALQKHIEESSTRAARAARPARRRRGARRGQGAGARPEFIGLTDWINTPGGKPLTLAAAARQGRADRLLDVLVHQLPAHAPAPQGLGRALPQGRARDRRRPHARVRVRARAVERARGRQAPRRPLPGRARQPVRDLDARTTTSTGRPST